MREPSVTTQYVLHSAPTLTYVADTSIVDFNSYSTKDRDAQKLLENLEQTHTKPLWAQMARINPPLPNPQTIPHIWKYDEIRSYLIQAGELITEKQAERRILVLVNPARGILLKSLILRL